ncbi:amidinotransferase [Laribacter hongkongensis]|uniref:Amidinotransferase n=1 Tax=Laribacter hongkongensis (strain HLHK9) TaxID=557598 RepID=C1DBM8_LARHH|nr:arginine deiminase-related protein [Laribacter hongkongensis]ACO73425.1 Putative amidinotransferase [Laribacter hongkongensis HLHK9]MCG8994465.1 amidinotransferase [Laribacter hongkongensis]MCG9010624.1 amidinotransferase [Laribacter hongkongensis]MCG9023111.1 amidinotransferase [Laribacter hongkongensis]MCG9046320.1 amidinotransferase [Laribacter hongkongensis]
MSKQITNQIVMVRPVSFYFDTETAANDFFQKNLGEKRDVVQAKALIEFDAMVDLLRSKGITVHVLQDSNQVMDTPDSIFPNNWFVSMEGGHLMLCPMWAPNRRHERLKFLGQLVDLIGHDKLKVSNYGPAHEAQSKFLEGTGAMILDRVNMKAYACLSPRCDEDVFKKFCKEFGFKPVAFHGFQTYEGKRAAIYHTNVMMALGEAFAVVCLSAIDDLTERAALVKELQGDGKEIIDVTEDQINNFAGNEIELCNADGKRFTIMTKATYDCLTPEQRAVIEKTSEIISPDVKTIETYGGGSVRCMISEIFL